MKNEKLLENLSKKYCAQLTTRRYNLADMISESYRLSYECKDDSNLKKLVEAHIENVKENPREIETLSQHLAVIKELARLEESKEIDDKVLKEEHTFKRPIRKTEGCKTNESAGDDWDEFLASPDYREAFYDWWTDPEVRIPGARKEEHESEFQQSSPCDDAYKRWQRDNKVSESMDEADEPELTDEELDELTKHLEEIRKKKGNAPQKPQSAQEKEKESMDEAADTQGRKYHVFKYSVDIAVPATEDSYDFQQGLDNLLENEAMQTGMFGVLGSEVEDMDHAYTDEDVLENIPAGLGDGKKVEESAEVDKEVGDKVDKPTEEGDLVEEENQDTVEPKEERVLDKCESCNESYKGLQEFAKKSSSKAFYKTFKKLDGKLHEGTALSREESIGLYKAANSALTQMSIELEHNPEFIGTFKESVSILSADVSRLLESLSNGKAPSKKNMMSLAKFSEALLYEADEDEDEEDVEDEVAIDEVPAEEEAPAEEEVSDEEVPADEETPEEDFVGDDEGDVKSEEAQAFDTSYAEERVELHKELEAENADSEDPEVQEKIEADKEEVLNLDGITDEQVAELTGEEAPVEDEPEEEPTEDEVSEEEPEVEENPEDDDFQLGDDDITDDELEELKSHLTEMRRAKKMKESANK